MYFKIEKLYGGSLFNKLLNANNRQLLSVLTSILSVVDGNPLELLMQAVEQYICFRNFKRKKKKTRESLLKSKNLPAISSNSFIRSLSNRGGRCLEKKSFKAVATAFTGMSRASMSMLDSMKMENMFYCCVSTSIYTRLTFL